MKSTNGLITNVKPKKKIFKKLYLKILLFFVGRGFQSLSKVDKDVKKEVASLPDDFIFTIKINPVGPEIAIQKTKNQRLKFINVKKIDPEKINIQIMFKNIERAFSVFTFQISAYLAYSQNGLMVKGNLPETMTIMRILTILEIYLMPKFIVEPILKRYPKWNFFYKSWNRFLIYSRIVTGI